MTLFLSSKQPDNPTQRWIWDPVTDSEELKLLDPLGQSQALLRHTPIKEGSLDFSEEVVDVHEPLCMDLNVIDPWFCAELSFTLSGYNHTEDIRQRENFLFWGWRESGFKSFYTWQSQDRVSKFDLFLSGQTLQDWLSCAADELPRPLQKVAEGSVAFDPNVAFWQKSSTTSQMKQVIDQILICPFQGFTQRLYREAKALELVSLRLAQLRDPVLPGRKPLGREDVDRIWAARQILMERLVDPPHLTELAGVVGLNEFDLKRGFKQVFGTTVFGYLLQQRMDLAKQILLDPHLTVETVANKVGYASRNAFARAFRRCFGIYPKDYRREGRHN